MTSGQAWLARDIYTGLGVFAAGYPVTFSQATCRGPVAVDLGVISQLVSPADVSAWHVREIACARCHQATRPSYKRLCPACAGHHIREALR